MDAIKQRFLNDRVLTATPAQRVVMLYDRLTLDLTRARAESVSAADADSHLEHATLIVAELLGSLDQSVAGPSANLASVYKWMLGELLAARLPGSADDTRPDLGALEANVRTLRDAWVKVAAEVASVAATAAVNATVTAAGDAPVLAAWTA